MLRLFKVMLDAESRRIGFGPEFPRNRPLNNYRLTPVGS
jgi:hypothetical protein